MAAITIRSTLSIVRVYYKGKQNNYKPTEQTKAYQKIH